jgi:hypothetical protein
MKSFSRSIRSLALAGVLASAAVLGNIPSVQAEGVVHITSKRQCQVQQPYPGSLTYSNELPGAVLIAKAYRKDATKTIVVTDQLYNYNTDPATFVISSNGYDTVQPVLLCNAGNAAAIIQAANPDYVVTTQ